MYVSIIQVFLIVEYLLELFCVGVNVTTDNVDIIMWLFQI